MLVLVFETERTERLKSNAGIIHRVFDDKLEEQIVD